MSFCDRKKNLKPKTMSGHETDQKRLKRVEVSKLLGPLSQTNHGDEEYGETYYD